MSGEAAPVSDFDAFHGAAEVYDLLYADKDYAAEAAFVAERVRARAAAARSLLDLGCGTGRHAVAFAGLGFEVLGVDRSASMLAAAPRVAGVAYARGEADRYRAGRTFDAVVSLFHVASYQVTDDALGAFFRTMRDHLEEGGVALFDFWYGPAVLADLPAAREKRVEAGDLVVTRRARPAHLPEARRVDAHYEFTVEDRRTGRTRRFRERHAMRYLFADELRRHLVAAGLRIAQAGDWLSEAPPRSDSWNAWMSAIAI